MPTSTPILNLKQCPGFSLNQRPLIWHGGGGSGGEQSQSMGITRGLKLEAGNHSAPENLFCPPLIMHPIVVSRAFFDQNRRGGVPLRCFIRIKEQIPYKASRNKKGGKENEKNYT